MRLLELTSTPSTPLVYFDPDSGNLKLEGRSIPENPGDFFDDIVDWLISYFEDPAHTTTFKINLEYVNSGSSKYLLGVFRVFKEAYSDKKDVKIQWYYEEDDEAIESLGEHYKSVTGIPFELVQYI